MMKYLKTSDPEFQKVFADYWCGSKKLPLVKGFPEGLDLENLEINAINDESIQIVAGGDWQEMIPFSFVVCAKTHNPMIVDLFYSSDKKTPAKEIHDYVDGIKKVSGYMKEIYENPLDTPFPGDRVSLSSFEMAPLDKHGVDILAGNDEYDDDMLPEYDFTGSYRKRKPYGESLQEGAKVGKLKHLTHLEDLIITDGLNGAQYAQDIIESLSDLLAGETPKRDIKITTKLDGCFTKDTLVETNEGFLSLGTIIKRVASGSTLDIVCKDLNTGEEVLSPLHMFDTSMRVGDKTWIKLTLEDGTELKCTADHPIYTSNRGYISASELSEDDDIFFIKD